ncbi:MAG: 6,7-dimethyl-8-ribityllumazine synthase, partial [Bacteroidales bacterium]|nr:6,7-dimethyl-8-ribityllumazine synthase [Bacteroidales bacterium]
MASELKNLSLYTETGIASQNADRPFKIGVAVSEWNQQITSNLAEGAIETLKKYGYEDKDI